MAGPVPLGGHAASLGHDSPMHIERTTSGALRVTSPAVPGWAATARTPQQLVHALREGWTEAAVVAYAARKGQPYDVTLHDQAAHEAAHSRHISSLPADADERETAISLLACSVSRTVTSTGGRASKTTHDPLAWSELPDGRWVSPTGRKYRADSQAVAHVLAKRLAMGVGAPPDGPSVEQLAAPSAADELWARRDRQMHVRTAMARHPAGKARPSA